MHIDDTLLQKLEKLSSLKISEEKREGVINQLSEIVAFVENLNELNLETEEATFTTVAGGTPFREDVPSVNPAIIKTILNHAPQSESGFFVVPKIIE
ncbi:Asp-tRNA(Asn)/Glu-tRNA(Gln) amidotransferase subunit GatC [Sulfurospirillum multivorans]|uniref:Aspartyl/glutamyl-tRNA(Asn/Gln) amidotransferase subunit C n=2 Tax=Sulfurospirillum multivorans TaxID=66821 RepID=A0AA86AM33_SULMK|nr:Asp-tRNA(Asn)/Glu-tRNA(Gln) amidotransferase subunit GatC [Sulfurospirillum multivorans]AHJ12028.1 aspartyl/glutamyl-tRNA(Asn/Gln) amidotransferase subunit C [Sulfurospirillum multivorans DSM 12446]QEH05531.1 aspartyl/glutamyl-tRNA(Asn/Gln) amidotransferase subunit C [Sulfurospirillum multivorans]